MPLCTTLSMLLGERLGTLLRGFPGQEFSLDQPFQHCRPAQLQPKVAAGLAFTALIKNQRGYQYLRCTVKSSTSFLRNG